MESIKVLIPTDFSVQAEFAYLMVKKMEEKIGVDIHFLNVMNVPESVTMDTNGNIQTCGEIDIDYLVKQKDIAERKLRELKDTYGKDITSHFIFGKITDGIIQFAEVNNFDLIVMGTKGSWGVKEQLSGSETQIVARKSKIPVLSLMCDHSDLDIRNILLVHNFNHPVKQELQLMHKLIKAFNTKFHLLQIASVNTATEKAYVDENMKTFAALNNISNYECHIINDKDVENGVIHFNQINNMDMVCIGTH